MSRKIFHFTKLETAIEFIFPKMELRSNSLKLMNDPKEKEPWAFGGVNIDYLNIYPDSYTRETHIEHQYRLGNDIKKAVQALCFVNSPKGYKNEMMWAHYGSNHSAICLEIDEAIFIRDNADLINIYEEIKYGKPKRVDLYWDQSKSKEENINQLIDRAYTQLFFSKSHYWIKENEKRVLSKSKSYQFFDISNSLTGVYYGLDLNVNYRPSIERFLNRDRVKLYYLYYENFEMKPFEVDYNDYRTFITQKFK